MRVLVFDSGVGGLSVVDCLRSIGSGITVDYAADAGFFPYGLKSDDELRARLPDICEAFVKAAEADLLVIACNTASTLALDNVRARLTIPVVGTVPAIKPAAAVTKTGVVGVLATPGTVRRAYLDKLESDFANGVNVIRHGSSGLVELAERSLRGEALAQARFDREVRPLFDKPDGDRIDVLVLACTHFPLIADRIAASCPQGVVLIDTGEAVARQAVRLIERNAAPNFPKSGNVKIGRAWLTGGRANRKAYAPALFSKGYEAVSTLDV